MILDIDMNRKQEIIEARKELYNRLALANHDKTAIADYLDFFDTRCVPLAIKCLPKKQKKQYEAKQRELMASLNGLKAKVGRDERKIYTHMNICAHKFNRFIQMAYFDNICSSSVALQQLFDAEFSSTISRIVYNELEPKFREKYFKDEHEQ